MNVAIEKQKWAWCFLSVAMLVVVSLACSFRTVHASTEVKDHGVVIIGKNYVDVDINDEGVTVKSKKKIFAPTTFLGAEGTALMLFLHNRITRDMGVDIVERTYTGRIERRDAEKIVDRVLAFYRDNKLVFKSRFEERPATKVGILRFRI